MVSIANLQDTSIKINRSDRFSWLKPVRPFWLPLLAAAVIVSGTTFVLMWFKAPSYEAVALLLIEMPLSNTTSPGLSGDWSTRQESFLDTQREIIASRTNIRSIVDELDPAFHPGVTNRSSAALLFSSNAIDTPLARIINSERSADLKIDQLRRQLSVTRVEETGLVQIAVRSANPELAASIVNLIAERYLASTHALKLKETELAGALFSQSMEVLFGLPNGRVEEVGVKTEKFSSLQWHKLVAGFTDPGSTRWGEFEVSGFQTNHNYLEGAGGFGSGLLRLSSAELAPVPFLVDPGMFSGSVYDAFVNRVGENVLAGVLQIPSVRIVDYAVIPTIPLARSGFPLVPLFFVLTLLLGVAGLIIRARLKNTIDSIDELAELVPGKVLALLPMLNQNSFEIFGRPSAAKNTGSGATGSNSVRGSEEIRDICAYSESMRTVRSQIQLTTGLDSNEQGGKIIAVTSSTPGEGKSSVALNLAATIGHVEKVLLIDGDLRSPSIAAYCGFEEGIAGLSHLIAGAAQIKDCIHLDKFRGIDVMPAGVLPPNPQELLSSRRFAKVFDVLKRRYSCIIVDSPSMNASYDALLLASISDAVILVLESESTSAAVFLATVQRLEEHGNSLAGVILNKLDVKKSLRYGVDFKGLYDEYEYGYILANPGGGYLASIPGNY